MGAAPGKSTGDSHGAYLNFRCSSVTCVRLVSSQNHDPAPDAGARPRGTGSPGEGGVVGEAPEGPQKRQETRKTTGQGFLRRTT